MIGRGLSVLSILAICALALTVAGCGGGSGGGTTTGGGGTGGGGETSESSGETSTGGETSTESEASSGSPSFAGKPVKKAEFVEAGDAICAKVPPRYQAKLKGMAKELKKLPKAKKEEEETLKAAVPPLRIATEEFVALGPPKGEEDKAVAIVEALEAAADGLEKEPKAPLSGPGSPFEEFTKLTKKFGFKGCPSL